MLHTILVVVSCPARRNDTEKLSVLLLSSIPMYMKNLILTHSRQSTFTPKTEEKRRSEQHTALQKLEIRHENDAIY